MSLKVEIHDLLIRYLDGQLTPIELARFNELVRNDEAVQRFLMESSEQAVMIADVERVALERLSLVDASKSYVVSAKSPEDSQRQRPKLARGWQVAFVASLLALMAVSAYAYVSSSRTIVARVEKVTGASQYFGAAGNSKDSLATGCVIHEGDLIESRSCDSWITLELNKNASLTIAGNTAIRVQQAEAGTNRFELLRGSLWYSPSKKPSKQRTVILSPTFSVEFADALLNVQTSESESIVRIHQGSAKVTRRLDGKQVSVQAGQQLYATLGDRHELSPNQQPTPVDHWSSELIKGTELLLGNWLPSTDHAKMRIGAAPLLWPVPDHEPVMLYALAISAWRCSEQPVVLHSNSTLRFRGRLEKAQTVRFGFSAQKMYSVFAGKFEIDVPARSLGKAGDYWEVELPLSEFQPLHPQLASSPEGLELTDVYALTIVDDAGLEINQIELVPSK